MLTFFRTHAPRWTTHSADLGLSGQTLTSLEDKLAAAETLFNETDTLRTLARAKTAALQEAMAALRQFGGDVVNTIRARAELNQDTDLYELAGIPAPRDPRRLKAPAAPTNVAAQLDSQGRVELTWQAPQRDAFEGKTYFIIERQLVGAIDGSPNESFTEIGTSHERRFTDTAVPLGWMMVQYRVIATRNGHRSTASQLGNIMAGSANAAMPPARTANAIASGTGSRAA